VLADRFDRRALMRWCEVGLACCAGLLLLNALLPRPSVAALFALVAVTMAVSSVQRPSMDASFPRLVPREQLTAAAAIMSFSQNISVVLGASLGGALAVAAGLSGWMGRVRRHGLAIAVAAAVFGLAIAGFGLSPGLYVALGCLVAAGGADEISAIFRQTLWNQTIPDELRGRLAGVELLSYGIGPSAGQLRSGVTASLTSVRFSLVSGGVCCVGGVAAVCALLPALVRYRAEDSSPAKIPAEPQRSTG
jgi:MFS family permease